MTINNWIYFNNITKSERNKKYEKKNLDKFEQG